MLGERIKKLRKQKKLTLEALAGNQLTKGMLSLIENNKAQPSMESLSYIAQQLEVEVSDLLEVVSSEELRSILEKAEKLYNTEFEKSKDKHKQLIELIEPFAENLTQGYEAARILEIYSYSLFHEKKQRWEALSERAAKMFDQMNISANRSSIAIFRTINKFIEHDYSSALEIFLTERRNIELNHAYIDPLTKLDLDYHEAVLFYAVGDSEAATRIMENALEFSKKKKIFYRVDELYRLAAAQGMMSGNNDKKRFYLEKLKQYAEFADNLSSLHFYQLLNIMTLTSEQREYQKALEEIDQLLSDPKTLEFYGPWFNLEKSKALYYLGSYEEALLLLDKMVLPDVHHPFDLSIFYVADTYRALCHVELGNRNEAVAAIKKAVSNFHPLPETPFKVFTLDTSEKISG
ncbi:helix-turn-helix domain-containing protein [Anaerobacillus isosaccharinicus]|uniref:Helix-turn-helix domain-containing protein n=1 Tax=Anaerobacillus isosaccharinicus TaxID=1532552 RepID=A0A1S2L5D8_9BACI|nr:helix-turn-helix transcriptional regulator [Anaerobacillus isosaccharinicus]MBA5586353.1 helix-turn-helix domain-containing protein [Anaerobacillus isosaccharinicus]QOY35400.1 helix-turn-helix domain-containing protein [Anaerobacillus isosaccharinicus]